MPSGPDAKTRTCSRRVCLSCSPSLSSPASGESGGTGGRARRSRVDSLPMRPAEYGRRRAPSAMGKYVFGRPTREIEADALGQEPKTCRRKVFAPFSCQKCIKLVLQRVQVQHIGCRIGDLSVRETSGAPVGQLLLLGNLDAKE